MNGIRVVSFDVEGTIATLDFSHAVWYEGVPSLYAEKYGVSFEEAKRAVVEAYDEVGDRRSEWYDIKYWFRRFQLGEYPALLERHKDKLSWYPEVSRVLSVLGERYTLIVASASGREFLPHLLNGFECHFSRVFSSISDYGQLKNTEFYTTMCREIALKPQEIVHVGDNWEHDFMAPGQAGINAFHLDRNTPARTGGSLTSLMDLTSILLSD